MTTKYKNILISRTDAIGDVTLTLPICGYLRVLLPNAKISFLGRTYTAPVIASTHAVDEFFNYDDIKKLSKAEQIDFIKSKSFDVILHVFPNKNVAFLAKKAGIPVRMGTLNRTYHWFTCNKLIGLSRRDSPLHEAQLNMIFLKLFGLKKIPELKELPAYYQFKKPIPLPEKLLKILDPGKFKLIIHPKSHGSGKEWDLRNYETLIKLLQEKNYQIFITGSEKEQAVLSDWVNKSPTHVIDLSGKLTLTELISFISKADGLVAASTGPLHLAGLTGIHCLGLFPSGRAINAKRWGPIGIKAEYLESPGDDLNAIEPEKVARSIQRWIN